MKLKTLKVLSCVATVALTLLGIHTLGYLVRPTVTDGAYMQVETFHQLPQNSIEVIVYGSSHAFRGINSMELYNRYGIGAYNYGWHWQGINTTKQFLIDSLLTQKPKLAIIETYYAWRVLEDTNIEAEIYYSRYLDASNWNYLKKCFGSDPERYLSYYMPLCAFHDNWESLNSASFESLSTGTSMRKNMGFSASNSVKQVSLLDPLRFVDEQEAFSNSALEELNDIVRICRNNNIDILFVTIPYEGAYLYNKAMTEFATENGYYYIDMFYYMDEIGLDASTDFSDSGHLNTNGSIKVTDYIGDFITNHYNLYDMRIIDGNLWETAGS